VVVFVFAFVWFFPNPALPIGGSTGLQVGQVLALLSLPVVLMVGLPRRETVALVLVVLPVILSSFVAVLVGHALSDEVAVKAMVSTALVLVVLVPAGRMVSRRHLVPLLSGVALAIVLHAAVGAYQAYSFAQDTFPLSGLYQNPSFRSPISEQPEVWATYVKRPFGLFPEPSAMAASIGPWLLLMVGLLLYPRLRYGINRGTMAQLLVAVVCGVGLILISSSGFTLWLLPSVLVLVLPYLRNLLLRLHRPRNWPALIALVAVGVAMVALSVSHVGSRADLQENSSWSGRLASITWGLGYMCTSLSTLIFGVGQGQSYVILESSGLAHPPPANPGQGAVVAVWSVVINFIVETGLLGAAALLIIMFMVVRAVVRSSARILGVTCLMTWLAGLLLTTSYMALLPIWLFLALLLEWDRIFPTRPPASRRAGVRGAHSEAATLKAPDQ
jgi:hypothetical protein